MGVALCFGKPVWISVLDRDLRGCLYILLSSGEASGFEGGGGSGGGATSGSRGRAPGQGVRGQSPPEAEGLLALRRLKNFCKLLKYAFGNSVCVASAVIRA